MIPILKKILNRRRASYKRGEERTKSSGAPSGQNQGIQQPATPFDFGRTGRFITAFETKAIVTRFNHGSAASRFEIHPIGDVFLSVQGRVGATAEQVLMRTYDGHELLRLYPTHDRRRQIIHIYDCRDLCYYTMCKAEKGFRSGYSTILIWKGEDGIGQPLWAMYVNKGENYAIIDELSSGRTVSLMDNRFPLFRRQKYGPDTKRISIMGQADMTMMTMLIACLEDICAETFGRNLAFATDLADTIIKTDHRL